MDVIRASVLGYCMGVRRAIELALDAAAAAPGAASPAGGPARAGPVYSLGPLIHNPQAVAELEAKGIVALDEDQLDERVAGKTVIIRAHGVPPAIQRRLESLGARIADATCPRVIASQRTAAAFARSGYALVLAGDRDHAEITGIAGCAREAGPGPLLIVGSPEEASLLDLPHNAPIAVIGQTTIKGEEYRAICAAVARRAAAAAGLRSGAADLGPRVADLDSICPATEERRRALVALASDCEAIVVVGGRNSANTSRLLSGALALGKPAWLVETAAELPQAVFGYARVGLAAGASTPDSVVDQVEAALVAGGKVPPA